jgi:hypothetical protein
MMMKCRETQVVVYLSNNGNLNFFNKQVTIMISEVIMGLRGI